jgi:diacylglycerol kinase (ATP)
MSDTRVDVHPEHAQTAMRARLILNPEAWQSLSGATTVEHIVEILRGYGINADMSLISPEHPGAQLAAEAVKDGYDAIIAGGGDGTVHEVVAGLHGTQIPLGILPLGTMNNLAYSLNIPDDIEGACAIIAAGKIHRIDLGMVNSRQPFVEIVSVGVEAALIPLADAARHHGVTGALRAAVSGLRMLWHTQIYPVTMDVDGKRLRVRAWQITICNTPVYGLRFNPVPQARLDDGLLDVVIARQRRRWDLLWHYHSLMTGAREPEVSVQIVSGRRVRIFGRERLPVAIDGQAAGTTPINATVARRAISVFAGEKPVTASPPPSPLTFVVRSLTPQAPGILSDKLYAPEETLLRVESLSRLYWLALPVVAVATLLMRLARWWPFPPSRRHATVRDDMSPEHDHPLVSQSIALALVTIFARLGLSIEVLLYLATGVIAPICRGLRFLARRHPGIVVPDEGTMRAVAGTGVLAAGLWASRRPTWRRNLLLVGLAGLGGWFARVGKRDPDTADRTRDSVALGVGLGALWLGASLGALTWLQRRWQQAVRPASIHADEHLPKTQITAPIAPATEDVAPVAIMTKLERGDLVLFGPDQSIGARLIEFLTRSYYHHVAIYDGEGMVIEAMPEGIRRFPLGDRPVTGIRPNVFPEQRQAAADWARHRVGGVYDRRGLPLIAVDRVFPGLRLGHPSASRYSCAVFVADAFLHAGADLFPGQRWQDLVPADFMSLFDMPVQH